MSVQSANFLYKIIQEDIDTGKHDKIITRFPPEPNGFLHIGHAKSICLNFGAAEDFGGHCSLRFDDTNPEKESQIYVDAIKDNVRWLGFDWGEHLHHASDYFEELYGFALKLIEQGKAFVCDLPPEKIREYRGTLTEAGTNSPYRDRSIEENIDLFKRMRNDEFVDGEKVLRAKIDMAAPNMNLRDPIIYRIRHIHHQRTGDKWCIYPTYDFTHGQSDAIEGVTHSLCTLEFEDHRPIYDWFVENIPTPTRPFQYEFSRLSLEYTVMSKRWLTHLVDNKIVDGWDDPRMPTISGLRRRGYTPNSIREFCKRIGITRSDNTIEMGVLEDAVRQDLDQNALRRMGVLDPIKLVIENYPEDQEESFVVANHPVDDRGTREVPFSRELYIERDDFMEDAPRKYFRLSVGREVRLKYAYYVTCTQIEKDDAGNVTTVYCQYDPESRGGGTADGRKVKGTIHWLSARHALSAQIRLYDRLFSVANPLAHRDDFASVVNPYSLIRKAAFVEPDVASLATDTRIQLERIGYFVTDLKEHNSAQPVLNRTVALRDSWAKKSKTG